MKYLNIIILISTICFSEANADDFYLLKNHDELIDTLKLKNYSKQFLRYARNEIVARKGYRFKDSDLVLYFSKQNWYKPLDKPNNNYNEIEKQNIENLKIWEEKADTSIIKYNDGLLAIINVKDDEIDHSTQYLAFLSSEYKWIFNCKSIPTEYLRSCSDTLIQIYELISFNNGIKIINFDKGYDNDLGDEVELSYEGPSDDPERVIIGMLPNGSFGEYISISSDLYSCTQVNKSFMSVSFSVRMDLAGTSFHSTRVLFNTKTKKVYNVPDVFIDGPGYKLKALKDLPVYYDPRSAVNRDSMVIVDTLKNGEHFRVEKFYIAEKPGAVQIEIKGYFKCWLNHDDFNHENIFGFYGAD